MTELPIILITSLSTREDREQGIDTGALAVVKRPPDLHHPQHKEMRKELLQTVKLMSEVKVVIVQHITKEFITGLQEWLSGTSSIMCLPRQKLRS